MFISFFYLILINVLALLLYYLVPYYTTYANLKNIPGPFFARISSVWLFFQAKRGNRYLIIDNAHKKYGKLVRIQPNHVSIADESAIQQVYGHGNGFLKSDYYNVFISNKGERNIFTTRNRAVHSRKRRNVAHAYSPTSINKYEKHLMEILGNFVKRWDNLIAQSNDEYVKFDCLHWINLLAFDIIGDLAFGKSFGMVESGQDITELKLTPHDPPSYAPAVKALNMQGEYNGALGCLPQLIPYAKYLPFPTLRRAAFAGDNLLGIAATRVAQRLDGKCDPDRVDILSHLIKGKNLNDETISHEELVSEAFGNMIAGSDTTSNTSCAILYWIIRTPKVHARLKAELDAAIPNDVAVPTYAVVKELPYLHNVIREVLRVHSMLALGLPRMVPPGPGVTLYSHYFPPGTVLSVPSYTIHHSTTIWGENADEFIPERWENLTERQKSAFIPFSHGPRSCIGRNLAMMELSLIIATLIHWWEFKLYTENLEMVEGFTRRPIECTAGVKRRSMPSSS